MRPALIVLILLFSCDKSPAKTAPVASAIGSLDLPLSRTSNASPSPGALEINIPLTDAKRAAPMATTRIAKGQAVKLRIHALVPYRKTAAILHQLEQQGVGRLWVAVRNPDTSPPKDGWMELSGYRTVDPNTLKVSSEAAAAAIPWEDFVTQWGHLYELCRASSQDCSAEPEKAPQGGFLQIALIATEHGARVAFQQLDAPAVIKKQRVQVMDFNDSSNEPQYLAMSNKKKPIELGAEALFTFRASASLAAASPITDMVHALCATKSCRIRIRTDNLTSTGRVLALLGAATSKGLHKPLLAFEVPR